MRALQNAAAVLTLALGSAGAQRAPVKLAEKPSVPAPKPIDYPKVVYDSLSNGLRFAIVENHELPLVVVQTAVAGNGPLGTFFHDAPGKPGGWALMQWALREGTTTRMAAAINDTMLDMGTDLRPATIAFQPPSFRAAKPAWIPTLNVIADMMINPAFPQAGLTRVQTQLAAQLDRIPPITVANRILMTSLYGAESPYAQFPTGASIRSLTRDDIVGLHQKYFRPDNVMISIAGDVTVAEARAALTAAFGSWQRSANPMPVVSPAAPASPAPTTIYLKDSPGLAQALIVAGQVVPGRDNPDATAIETVASLLGDFSLSSGSRVYNAFRMERGLSYSPRVELGGRPAPETLPLYATLPVAAGVVDTAVNTLLRVFRDLRQDKPGTASELDFAKRAMTGRVASELERVDGLASLALLTMRDGLPADYMPRWVRNTNAITLPQVHAAAAKYLDPDHMAIVVIADKARVEAALRATGLPVVIVP